MHIHNEVIPTNIIDLSSAKIVRDTGFTLTNDTDPLLVCLDTQNLGTKEEAYINGFLKGNITYSPGNLRISVGLALKPLADVSKKDIPTYVEITAASLYHVSAQTEFRHQQFLFVGWCDNTSGLGNGWDVDNEVTNYVILPTQNSNEHGLSFNGQILIKDIVSGEIEDDQILIVGICTLGGAAEAANNIQYTISARYATKSINTTGRGV